MASLDVSQILQLLGIVSVVTFVGSLLIVPWLIVRLEPTYFIQHRLEVINRHRRHRVLAVFLFILRNSAGLFLLIAGVAMLVLPGQGVLTILIGLSLMDFPGKYQLLEKVVQIRKVQQSLNWIRRKGGQEELVFGQEETSA